MLAAQTIIPTREGRIFLALTLILALITNVQTGSIYLQSK